MSGAFITPVRAAFDKKTRERMIWNIATFVVNQLNVETNNNRHIFGCSKFNLKGFYGTDTRPPLLP